MNKAVHKAAVRAAFILTLFAAFACNLQAQARLKVGMVPDTGTVNDKSFNQGTWEGILKAKDDFSIECEYKDPKSDTEEAYLEQIASLIDDGCDMVICAGFTFETAMFIAQNRWPNTKFVLLDGAPHNADYSVFETAHNTVAIAWTEHESGFVAGIAAAVQVQEGKMGFIGGMEIPAVQRYNWGWQRGIAYANWQYATDVTIDKEDVVYEGTFTDADDGRRIAKEMYDRGVRCIFAAAGAVGLGVIDEAKERRAHLTDAQLEDSQKAAAQARDQAIRANAAGGAHKGFFDRFIRKKDSRIDPNDIWMVGVDVDQYDSGMMSNGKSVVLTSAQKFIGRAAYDMIKDALSSHFKGGRNLELSARTDGVGIPPINPNLIEEAQDKAQLALKHMSYNVVQVKGDGEGVIP